MKLSNLCTCKENYSFNFYFKMKSIRLENSLHLRQRDLYARKKINKKDKSFLCKLPFSFAVTNESISKNYAGFESIKKLNFNLPSRKFTNTNYISSNYEKYCNTKLDMKNHEVTSISTRTESPIELEVKKYFKIISRLSIYVPNT